MQELPVRLVRQVLLDLQDPRGSMASPDPQDLLVRQGLLDQLVLA